MASVMKTPTRLLPSPEYIASPEHTGSLLKPWDEELNRVAYDLLQRYSAVAQLLDRMLASVQQPVRILEVGCNVCNLLPRFLDPARVHVSRCDVHSLGGDADFFLIHKDEPLPVAHEAFDAVVALEVLEHVPRDQRPFFMADCLRVARHGAIFTCPNGVPEVEQAEALAAAAYRCRHGVPHTFLNEHQEFGLPKCEEIVAILRDLDCAHVVFDNAPVDIWLAMMLLSENLIENGAPAELQSLIGRPFNVKALGSEIPYRKIYVCAKTFEATAALEPIPKAEPTNSGQIKSPDPGSLQCLALAASTALCELAARNQALETKVDGLRDEIRENERQVLVNRSFIQSLFQSGLWRLLTPIRGLRRLLHPRGFDATALIPWQDLEPVPEAGPGTWNATGAAPYFVVPCALAAGWLRLRLKMISDLPGQWKMWADPSDGTGALRCVKQGGMHSLVDRDELVYLPQSILSFRFDPVNAPGRFHVEKLEVTPVRPFGFLFHAVRNKWQALRQYGLVKQAFGNGSFLLLRGQWGEFFRKLRDGLHWSSKPSSAAPRMEAQNTKMKTHLQPDCEYPDLQLDSPPALDWSVVIPTINDSQRVAKCIQTCQQHVQPETPTEFLVVDDGTQDADILRELKRASGELGFRLLQNHQNLGFSATANHGMRHARGRIIILCNNDIAFFQAWLEPLQKAFDADPKLGIIGAKLLYPDGTVQHAGMDKIPGELSWKHAFGRWPGDHPRVNQSRYVWNVTGAFFAVRREVLQKLGGLSTAYATAYEDVDYCLRAWSHGVRIGYCADVAAYHEEGGTRGTTPEQKSARSLLWAERERAGRSYFEKKWACLRGVEEFESLLPKMNGKITP